MQTTVKWFNATKGYGFLENGAGPDIYVNTKSLRGTDKVMTGDVVEFECHVFEGKLVARHVRALVKEAAHQNGGNKPSPAKARPNHYDEEPGDSLGNREPHPSQMHMPRFVMR